jgi:hypothetical protein
MKNSEEAVEKVLAGLRNADAPGGMERRILDSLEALEDRAPARSGFGWRRMVPMWLVTPRSPVVTNSLVWGVALIGVFGLALAIPAIRRLGNPPALSKVNVAPVEWLPPRKPEVAVKEVRPVPRRPNVRSGELANLHASRAAQEADSTESSALQEMHAASQPAPPLPLTEQERLLLRIAHRGDLEEVAVLNPVLRAARDADEKAEVQRFFEAKQAKDNE